MSYISTVAESFATLSHTGTWTAPSRLVRLDDIGVTIPIQEPFQSGVDSQVPFCTTAATTLVLSRSDVQNWQNADGQVIDPILCSPKLVIQPIKVPYSQLMGGNRLSLLADKAMSAFCNSIWDQLIAPLLTVATFGTAVSGSTWTYDTFTTLKSIDAARLCMVLKNTYGVPVTWMPAAGGLTVKEMNRWSGADTNIVGLCCAPQAFVFRTARPDINAPKRNVVLSQPVMTPMGFEADLSMWFDLPTRDLYAAYSTYFAASVADTSACKLLTSA